MKKFIYIALIACASLFSACNDYDHGKGEGSSDNIDLSNLTATPRIGSVVLKWDNPSNPDYYYATVQYENADGEVVTEKVSVYSTDPDKGEGYTRVYITGFEDTNNYTFQVTPYTSYGIKGQTQSVTCAPEDAKYAYKYVAETAYAESAVEGGVVGWVNEYGVPVIVEISYKNILGNTVTETIESSASGTKSIGAFAVPTEVKVVTKDKNGSASSDPFTVTVTPTKGELPRENYNCISNSGGILGGGMEEARMFDGNWQSTWHSSTDAAGDVTMIIDLGAAYQVAMVEFVRRTDDPGAIGYPETIKVLTSVENNDADYEVAGVLDFDASYVFNHVLRFDPKIGRYIKLVISHSGNWTHLAEFVAYSNSDAKSRYEEESAAELVPDPDDDATIYPDTEYLSPMSIKNNLNYYQSNEDDPTEWTYETTGGDSWVVLESLKSAAPGPMLVFHYKSTGNLMCEFFWCDGGYGVGGPAGGKETAFNISKNADWKTFKQNFTGAWATWPWGNPGDQVRFDIGDGAGETVVVRLMHWRALADGE